MKQLRLLCALLSITIMGILATGCGEELLTDAEYVQRAKEQLDKDDPRSAGIELKNALKVNPDHAEARWLLGKLYIELGEGVAAEKELQRAAELGVAREGIVIPLAESYLLQNKYKPLIAELYPMPALSATDNAHLNALRGLAFLKLRRFTEAEAAIQAALHSSSGSKEAHIANAQLAVVQGRLDDARKIVDGVLQDNPTYARAWQLRGDLDRWQIKLEDAEQSYSKAIANSHDNKTERLKRALIRIALKDYENAAKDIQILKKVAPNHPGVNHAQGFLSFQQEKYAEAQNAFEKSLASDRGYAPAMFYLGAAHYAQQHHEQAEQFLSQYLNLVPNSATAAKMLAVIYVRSQQLDKAEALLHPVLKRYPEDIAALNLLANIALAQGKPQKGVAYLKKVVELYPDSPTTRARLGLGLFVGGESDEAINELETTVELNPEFAQAEVMLVMGYLQTGNLEQALAAAQHLKDKQPDTADPYVLLGLVHIAMKNEAEAEKYFGVALQKAPGNPAAAINLANIAMQNNRLKEARSLYQQVLKQNPDNVPALHRMALLEQQEGQIQLARTLLEKAVEADATAVDPALQLARIHLNSGMPDESLKVLQNIKKLYPNHPELLKLTGEAEMAMGRLENAMPAIRKLVEVQPLATNHYLLARAHLIANDLDAALRAVDDALAADSHYLPALVAQVQLLAMKGETRQSESRLNKLHGLYPDHPEVFMSEGWLANYQQRPQKAVTAYQEAYKRKQDTRVVLELAKAQLMAEDTEAGLATMAAWLKGHPQDMLVQLKLADEYMRLSRNDQARAIYQDMLKTVPNYVPALNNLAWLLREHDLPQAISYAEQAYDLAPKSSVVADTLAMLLLQRGDNQKALRLLQAINEHDKAMTPTHRYHLALALDRSGDQTQARQILQALLRNETKFPEAQQARELYQKLSE